MGEIIEKGEDYIIIKCLKKACDVTGKKIGKNSIVKVLLEDKEQNIMYPDLEYKIIFNDKYALKDSNSIIAKKYYHSKI